MITPTTPTGFSLDHDEVRDLLGAYAIGALDDDEQRAVERHLDGCAECRDLPRSYEPAALAIGSLAPPVQPPPALRARLLASAGAAAPASGVPAVAPGPAPVKPVIMAPRWTVWAVAAAAVLLIAGVAVLGALLRESRSDRDAAQMVSQKLGAYLAAGGQVTPLTIYPEAQAAHYYGKGSLVVAPDLPPLIVVDGCEPTEENRRYRVWLARGDDRTPVGELLVAEYGGGWIEVAAAEPLASYDAIGITMVGKDGQRLDLLVGPVANAAVTEVVRPRAAS